MPGSRQVINLVPVSIASGDEIWGYGYPAKQTHFPGELRVGLGPEATTIGTAATLFFFNYDFTQLDPDAPLRVKLVFASNLGLEWIGGNGGDYIAVRVESIDENIWPINSPHHPSWSDNFAHGEWVSEIRTTNDTPGPFHEWDLTPLAELWRSGKPNYGFALYTIPAASLVTAGWGYYARCFYEPGRMTLVIETNHPPVARISAPSLVEPGKQINLDGRSSSDPDNDPLSYQWRLVDKPPTSTAVIASPQSSVATLVPDVAGTYVVELEVSDGDLTSTATHTLVANRPPIVEAGPDRTVSLGTLVSLSGTATDPDDDPLSVSWSFVDKPPTSQAELEDTETLTPRFLADVSGTYVLELVVGDGYYTVSDRLTVTVNAPPVANAGSDGTGHVGRPATFDGSGSWDPEGDVLSYQWTWVSRPAGSTADFDDPTAPVVTFIPDKIGVYVAQLVVADPYAQSAPDTVQWTATNTRPVADAGPDRRVLLGVEAMLDGTASYDPDGDPLQYQWELIEKPPGSQAVLLDADTPTPRFVPDELGTYRFRLVVADPWEPSVPDEVVITPTRPPWADAGPDKTARLHEQVTFDGSGSGDPDGDEITYQWEIVERPPESKAMLFGSQRAQVDFWPDAPGVYRIRLTVSDGVAQATDEVILTVLGPPVADAGADQVVLVGTRVELDGSASFDPSGLPVSFVWTWVARPVDSMARLSDPFSARPSFVADVPGTYILQLSVESDGGQSEPDEISVYAHRPPVAIIDGPTVAPTEAQAVLDGSASYDPDGDDITADWELIEKPPQSQASLNAITPWHMGLMVDVPGLYRVRLTVTDVFGAVSTTEWVVQGARLPVAQAGPDQEIWRGQTAVLDGSGSYDPDGHPLRYEWTLAEKPTGSLAWLETAAEGGPVVVLHTDLAGRYRVVLIVDNGLQASLPDEVIVEARPLVHSAPSAWAIERHGGAMGPSPAFRFRGVFETTRYNRTMGHVSGRIEDLVQELGDLKTRMDAILDRIRPSSG